MRTNYTEHYKVCPWSVALSDAKVSQFLLASGMVNKWNKWPPGPEDPQLLEALIVIANEESRTL